MSDLTFVCGCCKRTFPAEWDAPADDDLMCAECFLKELAADLLNTADGD